MTQISLAGMTRQQRDQWIADRARQHNAGHPTRINGWTLAQHTGRPYDQQVGKIGMPGSAVIRVHPDMWTLTSPSGVVEAVGEHAMLRRILTIKASR